MATTRTRRARRPPRLDGDAYRGLATLAEALELLRREITEHGKPEYAALLSEANVRAAIRSALASHAISSRRDADPEDGAYVREHVEPVCRAVADHGSWPDGCAFVCFYALTERRRGHVLRYDGLGVRLLVPTPGAVAEAFALPIVDLYFGRSEA